MKKNKKTEEFIDLKDLIQMEKEEALSGFRKEDFQTKVHRRIKKESPKLYPSFFWLRRPVIAAGAVLLVIILGWVSTNLFLPSGYERESKAIEKNIRNILNSQKFLVEEEETEVASRPETELEWTIKRVLYAAQRERISDEEIPHIFTQVLQHAQSRDVLF